MGTLSWIVTCLTSIGLSVLAAWLWAELRVWHGPLINYLVRRTALKMPEEFQIETEAELLSWIDHTPSPTIKLLHALDLFFSAGKLRAALSSNWATAQKEAAGALMTVEALIMPLVFLIFLMSSRADDHTTFQFLSSIFIGVPTGIFTVMIIESTPIIFWLWHPARAP